MALALADGNGTTTALRGEFCRQSALFELADGKDSGRKLLPLTKITGSDHMIELLRCGSLANTSGGDIYRLTYILIDETFFTGLINEHYRETRDTLQASLTALFFNAEKLALVEDDWIQWSFFQLENELFSLLPLSGPSHPRGFIGPLT